MILTRFDDPQAFYDRVAPFWMQNEAAHNLLLGLTGRLRAKPDLYGSGLPYMAVVEADGEILCTGLRTPPHGFLLSQTPDDAVVSLFVDDLYREYGKLPSALGPKSTSKAFAELWQQVSGQSYHHQYAERAFQLTAVKPVTGVPGALRQSTPADHDLLIDWIMAFNAEALEAVTRELAQAAVERYAASGNALGLYLWEVDGQAVSMSGAAGPTPNGVRINAVYTPPQHRRRGYASACVAALSQKMLDSGRRFCFLFTDLANPTSNHIYQEIGYEPVCDVDQYKFV